MFPIYKFSRTLFAATALSTLAFAAQAAPVSFTFTGTASSGSSYDYTDNTSENHSGYTVEYKLYADDEAAPASSHSNSYAGYYSYDYVSFTVQQEINVYDLSGNLVSNSGLFETNLSIVDYTADTRDIYDEYVSFDAYYATSSTGRYIESYVSLRGDGPDSLFADGAQIDSIASLADLDFSNFQSPYFYYWSYDNTGSDYYSGTLTGTSSVSTPSVSAVPLPAGGALMMTGLAALGFARRRKQ